MQRAELDAGRLAASPWPIEIVPATASTNADLLGRDGDGDGDGDGDAPVATPVVLAAEHQSSGRGRLDRTWSSPPRAGLTFSVLLRPTVGAAAWGWLPLLAGVAVHDAVRNAIPAATTVALKWPNDVLLDERKLAGILAQSSGGAVVIGIGLNVSTTADELPVPTATSLSIAGVETDRTRLLLDVVTALRDRYDAWTAADGDARASGLAGAYRSACSTLGRLVAVTQTDGTVLRGRADDVDSTGRLIVDGSPVAAGDVEHLRPS